MKILKIAIFSAVFLLATQTTVAKGAWNENGQGRHCDAATSNLNLSATQKNQIQEIRQQFQKQRANKPFQKEMRTLMNAKQFDKDRAEDLLEKREELRKQMHIKRLQQQHAIYQVLNEQQRKQWLEKPHRDNGKKRVKKDRKSKRCN